MCCLCCIAPGYSFEYLVLRVPASLCAADGPDEELAAAPKAAAAAAGAAAAALWDSSTNFGTAEPAAMQATAEAATVVEQAVPLASGGDAELAGKHINTGVSRHLSLQVTVLLRP